MNIPSMLLALSVCSALDLGPLPLVELPPGEQTTFYLQRHLVNTADKPEVTVTASAPAGVPVNVGNELRSVTIGPVAAGVFPGNFFSVRIDVVNSAGEKTSEILPIVVRKTSTPTVLLSYKPERPINKVVAAGEINGWSQDKTPLTDPDGDGTYEAKITIGPGRYSYKFVVDGAWIADPSNENKTPDGFGGFNSILVVEGAPQPPRLIGRSISHGKAVLEFVPGAVSAEPSSVVAISEGKLLATKWNGNLLEVTLPEAGDQLVRVFAADANGSVSKPVRFYTTLDEWKWEDAVIYMAFIDRFANENRSNDDPSKDPLLPTQFNWQGGDLEGITRKIEDGYFDRLGANVLWISPFFEQSEDILGDSVPPPRKSTSYHGYGPVSERIEPRFGTESDLIRLVNTAHNEGMKVLFDMVYNHVHKDHPLVKEHPEMIVPLELPDGRQNLGLWDEFPLSTWFCDFWPDINYGYPAAIEYQLDMTERWIRKTGVDGFRLDAVKHVAYPFWAALRNRIESLSLKNHFYLVGETIDSRRRISEFSSAAALDGQFDFPLYWAIRGAFGQGQDGFDRVEAEVTKGEEEYPEGILNSTLLGNHDFSRFMAYADNAFANNRNEKEAAWDNPPVSVRNPASYEKLKSAWTFLLTNPGVPMIYYGDEIGLSGAHDPDNRRMMRWGADVTPNEAKVFEHVSALTKLRREHPCFRYGSRRALTVGRDEWAYLREYFGDVAIIAFNRKSEPVKMKLKVMPEVPDGSSFTNALAPGSTAVISNGGEIEIELPSNSSAVYVK